MQPSSPAPFPWPTNPQFRGDQAPPVSWQCVMACTLGVAMLAAAV